MSVLFDELVKDVDSLCQCWQSSRNISPNNHKYENGIRIRVSVVDTKTVH